MHRIGGWTMVLVGVLVAARPVATALFVVWFMHPYGGIPWSWDFILNNGPLFEQLVSFLLVGAAFLVAGIHLLRKPAWPGGRQP